MNRMSVDIPSVSGKPWGKMELAARIIRGTEWLPVLVYWNRETIFRSGIRFQAMMAALQQYLVVKFTPLILGQLVFGVHHLGSPIRDAKGALRALAVKVGKSLDSQASRLSGDILD